MSGNNYVMKPGQIAANFVKEIGQNPANFVMKLLGNNTNPMMKNLINMAQKGDTQGVKSVAENIYDRRYGRRDYDNYGARQRDSRGRYMTGRDDRGYSIIDDMNDMYEDYSGNKEEYNRGNYGAKDDTLKSLDYMLKSVVQFMEMLRDEATTDEEMQLIKKYARKISEM